VVLRDATSQQSDGPSPPGRWVHLVAELQALRGQIERVASSASDMARHLRELLGDRRAHDRSTFTIRFDC
jgi:hypothetical protein